jgi:Phage integrase, N-terminal SAM-like domain
MVRAPTTQTNFREPHESGIHVGGLPAISQLSGCPVGLQLQDAVEAFLLSRRVANCSAATIRIYEANLSRFARAAGPTNPLVNVGPLAIQHYLVNLRETMRPISADQHDRNLRIFFRSTIDASLLANDPCAASRGRGSRWHSPISPPRMSCVPS